MFKCYGAWPFAFVWSKIVVLGASFQWKSPPHHFQWVTLESLGLENPPLLGRYNKVTSQEAKGERTLTFERRKKEKFISPQCNQNQGKDGEGFECNFWQRHDWKASWSFYYRVITQVSWAKRFAVITDCQERITDRGIKASACRNKSLLYYLLLQTREKNGQQLPTNRWGAAPFECLQRKSFSAFTPAFLGGYRANADVQHEPVCTSTKPALAPVLVDAGVIRLTPAYKGTKLVEQRSLELRMMPKRVSQTQFA